MAVHHGKQGVVKIGAASVAEVTGFTYIESADTAESHACGDSWKERVAGMNDNKGTITCHYDPSDTAGQDALSIGAGVTLLLYFEDGSTTGEAEHSVPAIITEVGRVLERDSITERSYAFEGNGAPTEGTAT